MTKNDRNGNIAPLDAHENQRVQCLETDALILHKSPAFVIAKK
jgi:hypothetical protein